MRFSRTERDPRRAGASVQHVSGSLAFRADSRSSPVELIRFFRRDQIFGSDDLPAAIAPQPSVRPNEAPALAGVFFPRLASLRYRHPTVEPYFHVVETIRNEILRSVTRLIDHLLLGVQVSFGIDSDEIVSQNAFNCRSVACGDRFRPLPFAFEDVTLRFFLIFVRAAIAKAKNTENGQGARQHLLTPTVYLHVVSPLTL